MFQVFWLRQPGAPRSAGTEDAQKTRRKHAKCCRATTKTLILAFNSSLNLGTRKFLRWSMSLSCILQGCRSFIFARAWLSSYLTGLTRYLFWSIIGCLRNTLKTWVRNLSTSCNTLCSFILVWGLTCISTKILDLMTHSSLLIIVEVFSLMVKKKLILLPLSFCHV